MDWIRPGHGLTRYILEEPRDAAYAVPRMVLCLVLRRHTAACRGLTDPRHLAWRRRQYGRTGRR